MELSLVSRSLLIPDSVLGSWAADVSSVNRLGCWRVSLVGSCIDPVYLCDAWLVRVNDASKHRCKSRDFLDSICCVSLFPVNYNLRNRQRHTAPLLMEL